MTLNLRQAIKSSIFKLLGIAQRLPPQDGILLTFDDGPDPHVTPVVLELLLQYDAKSVFFIAGNRIGRAPQVLQQILAEGHLIGNHTYSHPLGRVPSAASYYREVQDCQTILEKHTGRRPFLFRPPEGALTISSIIAPRLAGLRSMMWSVDKKDWRVRTRCEAVNVGAEIATSAGPGDIILLHDDNPWVLTVLETALPELRRRQFKMSEAVKRFEARR